MKRSLVRVRSGVQSSPAAPRTPYISGTYEGLTRATRRSMQKNAVENAPVFPTARTNPAQSHKVETSGRTKNAGAAATASGVQIVTGNYSEWSHDTPLQPQDARPEVRHA